MQIRIIQEETLHKILQVEMQTLAETQPRIQQAETQLRIQQVETQLRIQQTEIQPRILQQEMQTQTKIIQVIQQ